MPSTICRPTATAGPPRYGTWIRRWLWNRPPCSPCAPRALALLVASAFAFHAQANSGRVEFVEPEGGDIVIIGHTVVVGHGRFVRCLRRFYDGQFHRRRVGDRLPRRCTERLGQPTSAVKQRRRFRRHVALLEMGDPVGSSLALRFGNGL